MNLSLKDLCEKTETLQDQVKRLERQIKADQKEAATGENSEARHPENGQNSVPPVQIAPVIKTEARDYLGMLEYQTADVGQICRALIWELQPRIAVHHLPGLPSYLIFMCIRYTDHLNDDNKVKVEAQLYGLGFHLIGLGLINGDDTGPYPPD